MGNFKKFIEDINQKIKISLPSSWSDYNEIELAQCFLEKLNEYFFQTYDGIGKTPFNGEELQYFSEFHKFWESNHKEILNPSINKVQARLAALALSKAVKEYGIGIFGVTHDTQGLHPEAVAQVRFFTANQDFRAPPEDQFGKYFEDPTRFEEKVINEDPEEFIKFLGVTKLSQSDKRIDFARNSAKFLQSEKIKAFEIAKIYNNDAVEIRLALVNAKNCGYGLKKANMFIRDMFELNVWPELNNFEKIDVASDINTMKLSLRTRIIQTEIPLLSSFFDIFCYQYGFIDEMSANAWRAVWEEWKSLDSKGAPSSPCLMDFLLYRIGREYCDEKVVEHDCNIGHKFYYFGSKIKYCPICKEKKIITLASAKKKLLPCQLEEKDLPKEKGRLLLKNNNLLKTFNGICIFENVCKPKTNEFHALNPPKSISIKGRTGWTNSYAIREKGGGGMMG